MDTLQWPRLLNMGEPEEMIRLNSAGNRITIHRRVVFQDGSAQVPIAQVFVTDSSFRIFHPGVSLTLIEY